MKQPKPPVPQIEVDDPEAAFHKLEAFTRKVLAAPMKSVASPAVLKGERKNEKRRRR